MALKRKAKNDELEPKPPKEIVGTEYENEHNLDGWVPSEDPFEGRWVDTDDECDEKHGSS
jgi:hypothetical protein